LSWQKERDRWLNGNIQPTVDKADIVSWLKEDPIWKKADKITWRDGSQNTGSADNKKADGSHFALIYIKGISSFLPKWTGDCFSVSDSGGRKVKKWIVEQLVKAYEQLEALSDAT